MRISFKKGLMKEEDCPNLGDCDKRPGANSNGEQGEIIRICAWCGKEMGRKPGLGQSGESHGICPECRQKYFPGTLEGKEDES